MIAQLYPIVRFILTLCAAWVAMRGIASILGISALIAGTAAQHTDKILDELTASVTGDLTSAALMSAVGLAILFALYGGV